MLDLEKLLDEDVLSSLQQREIRRLVNYRFDKNGVAYGFYFSPNRDDNEFGYGLDVNNLELAKHQMYKHVMTGILSMKTKEIQDDSAINQIKTLLSPQSANSRRPLLFKDGNYLINDSLHNKAQNLYKAVMIVKKLGLINE